MATFAISFRIAETGNDTERYQSFIDAVDSENQHHGSWKETTSFFLIKSDRSAGMLRLHLTLSDISSALGDKFVVIDLDNNEAAHFGIDYPSTFGGFFS